MKWFRRLLAGGLCFGLLLFPSSSADGGHTCPDYSQHDAVLRQGQDCLKNAPASPGSWQPPVFPGGAIAPYTNKIERWGRTAIPTLPSTQTAPDFKPVGFIQPKSETRVVDKFSCIQSAIGLAVVPKQLSSSYRESQAEVRALLQQFGNLSTEQNWEIWKKPWLIQARGRACDRLLGALSDYPGGTTYAVDTELLSSARSALESLQKQGSVIDWRDSLCLAGVRALFGEYDSALSICEKLATNKSPSNFEEVDADPLIAAFEIAICNRKGDWQKLKEMEDDCAQSRNPLTCNALLDVYVARGRTGDFLRFYRKTCTWQDYSQKTLCHIIQCAEDEDIPRIAKIVQRCKTSDMSTCRALAKRRFFGDALTVCLNMNDPLASKPAYVVSELRKKYPTDFMQRLVFASSICFELKTRTFGRSLLTEISEPCLNRCLDTVTQTHENLRDIENLIHSLSSITNPDARDVLQSLKTRREYILKRKETLEYLAFAAKLEEACSRRLDNTTQAEENLREIENLIGSYSSITHPKAGEGLQRLRARRDYILKRREILECLTLAEKLEETGNSLLVQGQYAEAKKVYTSALDIRRKQLKPTDCLIGNTLQNLAQTNMMLKDMEVADQQFEESLNIYRNAKASDLLKGALEMYGSFLNYTGNTKKASIVYQEAKQYSK